LGPEDRLVRPLGLMRRPCREMPCRPRPDHDAGGMATIGVPTVAVMVDQLRIGLLAFLDAL